MLLWTDVGSAAARAIVAALSQIFRQRMVGLLHIGEEPSYVDQLFLYSGCEVQGWAR
jgi:hypothetical protein